MKKDRLDDLAESLKQIKSAMLVFESASNDCYPGACNMDRVEVERKRHKDRANMLAGELHEQNDCLRRLGLHIAAGAKLAWGNRGDPDCRFYLLDYSGCGIAGGDTMQELIANIPKGE